MAGYVNYDNAQSNRWFAVINNLPGVELRLHNFVMPGLSIGSDSIIHRGDNMVTIPGDAINIENITLQFLVDSKYHNYFQAYRWMRSNVANNAPEVSDITVTLLDNQGNPQGTQVVYKECYPLALDQVELDSGGEVHDIIGTLTIVCNDLSMQVKLDEKTILSYPDDYGSV